MDSEAQSNPEAIRDSAQARREFRERTKTRLSLNWAAQSNDQPDPGADADAVDTQEDQQQETDTELLAQQLDAEPAQEVEPEALDDSETVEAEGLDDTEDADDESDADEGAEESEPEEGSIEYFQKQAQEAIEDRDAMQKDYTRKTQAVADLRRNVEELAAVAMTENSFYVQQAEAALQQRFGNINFEQLRIADPEKHQKMIPAYQAMARNIDSAKQRHQNLRKGFEEQIEKIKDREAELSRDILRSTIKDWGNGRVEELREFAVNELGLYDEQTFNELTDWRPMALLDKLQKAAAGPKTVKQLRKTQSRRPKAGANRKPTPVRNEKGQFTKSRQTAFEQPGNRQALRQSFQDRLKAERAAGGTIRY